MLACLSEASILATDPDPLYREGMANADKTVGYEFYRDFYADVEKRLVLKSRVQIEIALTQKEFEVLEFFLRNPKKVIAREAVAPLDKPAYGRHPVDNYLSRIAKKLGLEKEELFKSEREVGYSLKGNVRRIFASDQQEGGDLFKAAEVHFKTHTIDSMRASLKQSLRALEINPYGLPDAHITAAYDYINLGGSAYSAEPPRR